MDNDLKLFHCNKETNKRYYEMYNIVQDRAETKDLSKEMPENCSSKPI